MEKIKLFLTSQKGKDILTIIIVILVGLGSFGLGRLSNKNSSEGIKIEYQGGAENQAANVISTQLVTNTNQLNSSKDPSKAYFASNRGSKYYSLGCSGGKTIKQENRIYFSSSAEAEQAGYELSSSCK